MSLSSDINEFELLKGSVQDLTYTMYDFTLFVLELVERQEDIEEARNVCSAARTGLEKIFNDSESLLNS